MYRKRKMTSTPQADVEAENIAKKGGSRRLETYIGG
jgi:hypothetical protein